MAAVRQYKLAELTQDSNNLKRHATRDVDAIAASLRQFGQQTPIVIKIIDDLKVIIKGNGTFLAATQLGWETIACIETQLDGDDLTAYALADNHTATLSEWDVERLEQQVRQLDAELVGALGFDQKELDQLLRHDQQPAGGTLSVAVPDQRDSYSIRVDGIDQDHKDAIARDVAKRLADAGFTYTVEVK